MVCNLGAGVTKRIWYLRTSRTGHRAGSIRQLRWSDVDLGRRLVTWRAETDKIGYEHTTPLTRDAAMHYWKRLAARAGLPTGARYGWHSCQRKFATELKQTNLKDLCALGGWKGAATLLTG
jgi:integrase